MKKLTLLIFTLAFLPSRGSELTISKPLLYIEGETARAVVNVHWENAWHNTLNHDGVWLFCKSLLKESGYQHIAVLKSGHRVVEYFSDQDPKLEFEVAPDGTGLIAYPTGTFRGIDKSHTQHSAKSVEFRRY